MSYGKPELVVLGTSVQVIQGSPNPQTKGVYTYPEIYSPTTEYDATIGAYEADE